MLHYAVVQYTVHWQCMPNTPVDTPCWPPTTWNSAQADNVLLLCVQMSQDSTKKGTVATALTRTATAGAHLLLDAPAPFLTAAPPPRAPCLMQTSHPVLQDSRCLWQTSSNGVLSAEGTIW